MTDVVDGDVVVLAPEEWHVGEGSALVADDCSGDGLALVLRKHPVPDTHLDASVRVWPARDVADGAQGGAAKASPVRRLKQA
jgi:hypothetical protein